MAEPTPSQEPAPAGKAPSEPQAAATSQPQEQQKDQKKPAPKQGQDAAAPAGEKKLSGAELKKKAKEEKAARRAQAKAASSGPPSGPQQQGQQGGGDKGGKGKPKKQDGQQGQQQQSLPVRTAADQKPKEEKSALPDALGHLSLARRPGITGTDKDVQQPILILGQHMAAFNPQVRDSTDRIIYTLAALKKVINSYTTPQGTTFSRHFTSNMLNPQIEHLSACRPMCFGMGNAIRWLKLQISKVDIDLSDFEVKKQLCNDIDIYAKSRIALAQPEIAKQAAEQLRDGDTVLTYGDHSLVRATLVHAHENGKNLRVIFCEDPHEPQAQGFVRKLKAEGIQPRQIEISFSHSQHGMKLQEAVRAGERVTVLSGAEAMFTDGALYARHGTADIAAKASKLGRNFVALCETINVTERVAADSQTLNEFDPEMASHDMARLLFDVTPAKNIARIVTEFGSCPPESMDTFAGDQDDI